MKPSRRLKLDAVEIRILLDYIERMYDPFLLREVTDDEKTVLSKLREFSAAYIPACRCELCGRPLYPVDPHGRVLNFRGNLPPHGCSHVDGAGRSSLRPRL